MTYNIPRSYYLFWNTNSKRFVCISSRTHKAAINQLTDYYYPNKFLFMKKAKCRADFNLDKRMEYILKPGEQITIFDRVVL